MITKLIRGWERRKLAKKCALLAHDIMMAAVSDGINYSILTGNEPTEEMNGRALFWMRATVRYNRLRLGKSPWRPLNATR
jgi:hypothetical protein